MKCSIQGCPGEYETRVIVHTVKRGADVVVFENVPAEVCANCGEAYVAEEVSRQILAAAEHAARSGVQVDVREFVGAVT